MGICPLCVSCSVVSFCDPRDCSLPASSIHGILQARTLEGLPFPPTGHLPDPGIKSKSSALQADSLSSEPPLDLWMLELFSLTRVPLSPFPTLSARESAPRTVLDG